MTRIAAALPTNSLSQAAANAATEGRIAALDSLRAAAMFLGVCLHAAVSYMAGDMPGLLWVVRDNSTHFSFDIFFWWLHGFRLPLFFFLAGFFAALVEAGRGSRGLLAHRFRRLFVPFVMGCLVILPFCFYIWSAGWLVSGRCTLKEILAIKFGPHIQSELYGPLHLWFLEDLFLLTLVFCAYRWLIHLKTSRKRKRRTLPVAYASGSSAGWWRSLPLWLSVPTTLVLTANLRPVLAHHNSFVPDVWRLMYYGLFFAVGAITYSWRKHLAEICRWWSVYLALSVPVTALLILLLQYHLEGQENWASRLALATTLSLLAWLSVFGFLGLGLRHGNAQRPIMRYLADASYWVYLCHLPLVGLIQLDLEGIAWPAGVKFLVVIGLTALLALASYHMLVRYTFVGACLHGRRHRPTAPTSRKRKRRNHLRRLRFRLVG
ncbi:MAG: acyltransferase family protein [Gemmataceae bacterium]